MGMFDKPQYLTGKDGEGFVQVGQSFWLHNARLDGTTNIGGATREQVKLLVSHEREEPPVVVYTSGVAIANQVKRMDASDRAKLPLELRLDAIPATQPGRNPTNVLTPADEPAPSGFGGSGDAASADF